MTVDLSGCEMENLTDDCKESRGSAIPQRASMLDTDDCGQIMRRAVNIYSGSRFETSYPAGHAENGSEITIHDKAIITEKLISLAEMNGTEGNISKLKQEEVVAPLPSEQKSTSEMSHLKFVVGVFTHNDSVDEIPNTLILDSEAKSVLERSDSQNDMEKISICKEPIS
ncbi:hypothetical protein KSP40_PGU007778 [Platanthera guangdongensis]|uniref:Uncharacterized protein n=1 Tax=Platanthera guangdongensis TaxID=2320717 RepID=A0ABR2LJZ9_9ASPA